jgi:hypothetical protein
MPLLASCVNTHSCGTTPADDICACQHELKWLGGAKESFLADFTAVFMKVYC